jgi:hypothetical protein
MTETEIYKLVNSLEKCLYDDLLKKEISPLEYSRELEKLDAWAKNAFAKLGLKVL